MTTGGALLLLIEIVFLGCLGLCIWKRLWIALGVLVSVIVVSNALFVGKQLSVLAFVLSAGGLVAMIGTFFVFPIVVYFNLEGRERHDRRSTIRRSRRHTGRE